MGERRRCSGSVGGGGTSGAQLWGRRYAFFTTAALGDDAYRLEIEIQ